MEERTLDRSRSNNELIAALASALRQESVLIANVIAMLIEVDERQLHLQRACPSMYLFCTKRLGMSEGAAYRRATAALMAKKFPVILDALREGRVHLSNLVQLRDLVTEDNVNELLSAIAGKSRRDVEALVAKLAPKKDVRGSIRKVPERVAPSPTPSPTSSPTPSPPQSPPTASPTPEVPTMPMPVPTPTPTPTPRTPAIPVRAQLTPLAETRHKVQFTASTELRQKLERAQALMRHRNVDGDLAVVVERAMDMLIAKLEKEKLAATSRPHAKANARPKAKAHPNEPKTKAIPAAVRREIVARDGEQCAFHGPDGERCPARDFLEIDHVHPRARGGDHDVSNLRLLCRAHNRYAAELVFGRQHVSRAIDFRRRKKKTRGGACSAGDGQMPLPE